MIEASDKDGDAKYKFLVKKISNNNVVARTNHGQWLDWAGYQRKPDNKSETMSRISSESRLLQAQAVVEMAKDPEDLVDGMCQVYINNPQLNIMRTSTEQKKMRTTSQQLCVPKENTLTLHIQKAVQELFGIAIEKVEFQATRKEFEGDITMVVFPLVKALKGNPVEIGNHIGNYLVANVNEVAKFNVVGGFLNIVISDAFYVEFFNSIKNNETFGFVAPKEGEKAVMVEYSSPNTNKPLHLGHIRNNLLGYSVAEISKASGKKVYKTQIINDRGIHICKYIVTGKQIGRAHV